MPEDLKSRSVTGATWLVIAQVSGQILKFAVATILARLLAPQEFGLIAMVLVFSGFARLFNDMGFSAALIQKQDVNERHFSSIFWLNVFASLLLMALLIIGAPLLASFFDQPRLVLLARVLSLEFLVGSVVIVQRALLTRSMDFRLLALSEIVAVILSGILGIVLAFRGFGVHALVAQILALAICQATLIWWYSSWRPRRLFSRQAISELFRFSIGIAGGNALNYWIRNADNLLIGKFLGSTELGLYSRAYMVMLLPLSQLTFVLTQVMFPALSSIQGDKERSKRIYLRAVGAIALLTFPTMLGLLVVAEDFVLTLFGPNWAEMIPVLQVLCVVGMLQSVNSTVGWVYNSQGRSDMQFWWILFVGILTFAAIGIGIRWGIFGVAVAYATRVFSTSWLNYSIPGRLIGMSVAEVIKTVYLPLLFSVAMASLVAIVGLIIPDAWSNPIRLLVLVALGFSSYAGLVHWCRVPAYTDLLRTGREASARMRRGAM